MPAGGSRRITDVVERKRVKIGLPPRIMRASSRRAPRARNSPASICGDALRHVGERDVGDEAEPAVVDADQRQPYGASWRPMPSMVPSPPSTTATSARRRGPRAPDLVVSPRRRRRSQRGGARAAPRRSAAAARCCASSTAANLAHAPAHASPKIATSLKPRGASRRVVSSRLERMAPTAAAVRTRAVSDIELRRPMLDERAQTAPQDADRALHRRRSAGRIAHAVQVLRTRAVAGDDPQRHGRPRGARASSQVRTPRPGAFRRRAATGCSSTRCSPSSRSSNEQAQQIEDEPAERDEPQRAIAGRGAAAVAAVAVRRRRPHARAAPRRSGRSSSCACRTGACC